jgi:cbb3-type cytochrome oxidase subunit 3
VKSEFLSKSPLLALPLAALFLFLLVFAAVVVLTMRRKATTYEPIATLPLDDEPTDER